jgi:hypothetical protein
VKHFSDEDWMDFIRGVMSPLRLKVLEDHLRSECPECSRLRRFWENVRDLAQRNLQNEAPSHLMDAEEAIFKSWRRVVLAPQAKRAYPIYDSLLVPLPAGVRATASASRRVVHRWHDWTVDLRIDAEPSERLTLIGQIIRAGWLPEQESKSGVLLMSRENLLQETGMNQFGEFQFTVQRAPELTIVIELPRQQSIAIALPPADQPLMIRRKSSV